MNAHYAHLTLNHLPLAALLFGLVFYVLGLTRRSEGFERAGLGLLVAAALLAIPVLLTGEGAEEVVEHLPGTTRADHRLIHEHEEHGERAFWVLQLLGVVALIAAWARGPWPRAYRFMRPTLLLIGGLVLFLLVDTARHGGQIRRPELREGYVAPAHDDHDAKGDEKEGEAKKSEEKSGESAH